MALSFDKRTVLITGAGGGLGKSYALLFAKRGATVIVNDFSKENADKAVEEIKQAGGTAYANYDSVLNGKAIIDQCIATTGRIDVVINNAGILRDKSFKAMSDKEFNDVIDTHCHGAFYVTHAAWPHMRKQKFGRIINTSSAAGIYGSFGQSNYSSAKFGLVGFAKTLAIEGAKYNINANAIAPIAASPMTRTIMPEEVLKHLTPDHVAPVVAWLCHESCTESGKIYEMGAGWTGEVRWELSNGVCFKQDATFTPSAVAARFADITDFSDIRTFTHPFKQADVDIMTKVEAAKKVSSNDQGSQNIQYKDKVVLITGAGAGIGRAYALMYAKLGAKVVVNDFSEKNALAVVEEIKKAGGVAAPAIGSVEDGDKVVQAAIDAFGTIHVLINNAGILRDKSFLAMTEKEWKDVVNIHLIGSYKMTKAAWPIFLKQKYGRVINTSSIVGVTANFGQSNYALAKSGLIAFSKTLALEGKKNNIQVNALVPTAGSAMTATVWPKEMLETFSPNYVAPLVGYLTSEECEATGRVFTAAGGWIAEYRWQRTAGVALSNKVPATPETIRDKWQKITLFDENCTNPADSSTALSAIMGNLENEGEAEASENGAWSSNEDPQDSKLIKEAKLVPVESIQYTWGDNDAILYNIGIGARAKELKYTFEGDENFQVLPTFAVIPQFIAMEQIPLDFLPNYNPMMLLHGEQYIDIRKPFPTSGSVTIKARLLECLDKGKAAAVTEQTQTIDNDSGEVLAIAESTLFIRNAGGFGGKKTGSDRGAATAVNKPPSRKPDTVSEFTTTENQAAIYRLAGDKNPLHIDPEFAKVGGFRTPILHGLCFFGIAGKAIFDAYGPFNSIKVRFAGHLFPGETVVTEMWKEDNKVIFVARCKERDTIIISNAAVTLS